MADLNAPNVRVQVLVKAKTKHGKFTDAIYYSKSQYDAMSEAAVTAAKDARIAAWVAAVDYARANPAPPPTRADRIAERDRLQAEADLITAELAR